jgi:quercetin dioxygenase-like cupin family protein
MGIDVRRFGAGHRRPEGPPGTHGVTGQVIHSDARGLVAELAFAAGARIAPHHNPNTTWLCVIEGGGWVLVGDERRPVAAGEAVLWPAGVTHAAWTEALPMRAFVVEFAGPDDAHIRDILEGAARAIGPGERDRVSRGEGRLAPRPADPSAHDRAPGEPF